MTEEKKFEIREGMTLLELALEAKAAGVSQEELARMCTRNKWNVGKQSLRSYLLGIRGEIESLVATGRVSVYAAENGITPDSEIMPRR